MRSASQGKLPITGVLTQARLLLIRAGAKHIAVESSKPCNYPILFVVTIDEQPRPRVILVRKRHLCRAGFDIFSGCCEQNTLYGQVRTTFRSRRLAHVVTVTIISCTSIFLKSCHHYVKFTSARQLLRDVAVVPRLLRTPTFDKRTVFYHFMHTRVS